MLFEQHSTKPLVKLNAAMPVDTQMEHYYKEHPTIMPIITNNRNEQLLIALRTYNEPHSSNLTLKNLYLSMNEQAL